MPLEEGQRCRRGGRDELVSTGTQRAERRRGRETGFGKPGLTNAFSTVFETLSGGRSKKPVTPMWLLRVEPRSLVQSSDAGLLTAVHDCLLRSDASARSAVRQGIALHFPVAPIAGPNCRGGNDSCWPPRTDRSLRIYIRLLSGIMAGTEAFVRIGMHDSAQVRA